MEPIKRTKVFMTGRSQAVRIPAEYRFSTKEVYVRRDPKMGTSSFLRLQVGGMKSLPLWTKLAFQKILWQIAARTARGIEMDSADSELRADL